MLKRFLSVKFIRRLERGEETGYRVAVVGAGPAGLAAAGELACRGHEVHVYDRLPEPGGMLMFVIPDFRFPKKAVRRAIKELKSLGVEFRTRVDVSSLSLFRELLAKYDALVVATGAWSSRRLGVRGEEARGVYYALEWVYRYMLHKLGYAASPEPLGERVAVVGAGLTAADVCEILVREYGVKPTLIYRRPLGIAPAAALLAKMAVRGIIEVVDNALPLEVIGGPEVKALKLISVKPTRSRRERVVPLPGTERVIDVDAIIVATGLRPTPPKPLVELGAELEADGRVRVRDNMMTSVEGVFAAGDVAQGPSTVYRAMESGWRAARHVDAYLRSRS